MPIGDLLARLRQEETRVAVAAADADSTTAMLLGEVCSRLGYLDSVGLGYLSLDIAPPARSAAARPSA